MPYRFFSTNSLTHMKFLQYLMPVICVLLFLGCSINSESTLTNESPDKEVTLQDCDFIFLEIKAFEVGTDKLLDEKLIEGCFNKKEIKDAFGLIEVEDPSRQIKISYFAEEDHNILRHLDIRLGSAEPSRWRRNEGHDIFINEENGELNFIFGDRKKSKIKGTLKLYN